jgi:mRNA-degrading endonuclease RelE of RelBE toxin-antitoxin system
VSRRVVLSPAATRQLRALRPSERSKVVSAMRLQLGSGDPRSETRNRFRLRRPSEHAEYELRVEQLRVFYRVVADEVQVVIIGRKVGNALVVEGKRFVL